MKNKVLIYSLFFLIMIPLVLAGDCEVKPTCDSDQVELLKLSSITNAHAALVSTTDYTYKLCCPDSYSASTGTVFLRLSEDTNAHVQEDSMASYTSLAEISSLLGAVTCEVKSSCTSEEDCLLSLIGDDNSHVSDCTDSNYPLKICCKVNNAYQPVCGNGQTDPALGEECDDGDTDNTDECTDTCTSTFCGDGISQDKNGAGDAKYDNTEYCDGSDFSDLFQDIQCSNINNPACKNTGMISCFGDCTVDISDCCPDIPTGGECGDGIINQRNGFIEECDVIPTGSEFLFDDCSSINSDFSGDLSCNDDCTIDFSACTSEVITGDCDEDCSSGNDCNNDCGNKLGKGCKLDPDCTVTKCQSGDDNDEDGIDDECDLCKNTPNGASVDLSGCSVTERECIAEYNCANAHWGECLNGYKERDVSLCIPSSISSECSDLDLPPSKISCIPEQEEFPVYTPINALLSILLIIGFYLTKSFKN